MGVNLRLPGGPIRLPETDAESLARELARITQGPNVGGAISAAVALRSAAQATTLMSPFEPDPGERQAISQALDGLGVRLQLTTPLIWLQNALGAD